MELKSFLVLNLESICSFVEFKVEQAVGITVMAVILGVHLVCVAVAGSIHRTASLLLSEGPRG